MNKKLPKIAALPINKKISHNKEVFYSKEERVELPVQKIRPTPIVFGKKDELEILEKINSVFHSTHHSFHIPVEITTKDKVYQTRLAGKFGNKILTMDDEEIFISDIIDFQIKEK